MKLQAHKKIWKNINIEYASEKEKWEGLSFLYQPGVGVWDSNPKEYGLFSASHNFFSLPLSISLLFFCLFILHRNHPQNPKVFFFLAGEAIRSEN